MSWHFCNFKIHLLSILNTNDTNYGIFSNKAGENFDLAKIFFDIWESNLNLVNNFAEILLGKQIPLDHTESGHYFIPIKIFINENVLPIGTVDIHSINILLQNFIKTTQSVCTPRYKVNFTIERCQWIEQQISCRYCKNL